MKALPTQQELKELFNYNPETGEVRWKVTNSNRAPQGSIAGGLIGGGYKGVRINGTRHMLHRVIWCLVKGAYPAEEIDHINRVRADNRLINLRAVTRTENQYNRTINNNNSSTVTGVHWEQNIRRWVARIKVGKKQPHCIQTKCFDEAVCHRLALEQCLDVDRINLTSSASIYVKKNVQREL